MALINAVENGNIDEVRSLIGAGANINAVVGTNYSNKKCALTAALRYPEILKLLIESGANLEIALSQKKTPLHYAAESENWYEALCILLGYGANPNAIDLYGRVF